MSRALSLFIVAALCGLGYMLLHLREFDAPAPADEKPAENILPLEQAAPEAIQHREAFRELVRQARQIEAACAKRDPTREIPDVRGQALIWDGTRDDLCEAHGRLPAELRAPNATGPVLVFVVTQRERKPAADYMRDIRQWGGDAGVKGYRNTLTVCVIAMPAFRPLGKFTFVVEPPSSIRVAAGQKEVDGDWNGRLRDWVEGCVHGPAWREQQRQKKIKEQNPSTPKGQEHLEKLAELARPALPACKARGAAGPVPKLPARAVVWYYSPAYQVDRLSEAQRHLPAAQQPGPGDAEVTVFFWMDSQLVGADPAAGRTTERFDQTLAVVTLPGAMPVGEYVVRGQEWPHDRPRSDRAAGPDQGRDVAQWVTQFLDAPEKVIGPRKPPRIRIINKGP